MKQSFYDRSLIAEEQRYLDEKDFFCENCNHEFDSDDGDWQNDDVLYCPECGQNIIY